MRVTSAPAVLPAPLGDELALELAAELGTPLTILLPDVAARAYADLRAQVGAVAETRVALKAAAHPVLAGTIAEEMPEDARSWLDVGSIEEYRAARALGIPAAGVHFYAPGAQIEDLAEVVASGAGVTFDSLRQLSFSPRQVRDGSNLLVRTQTTTSLGEEAWVDSSGPNKLGMELSECVVHARELARAGARTGFHAHLGSMVLTPRPYLILAKELIEAGRSLETELTLNLGGGMPYRYQLDQAPFDLAGLLDGLRRLGDAAAWVRFALEPGRAVFANAAVHLCMVRDVKPSGGKSFLVTDGRLAPLGLPLPVRNCSHGSVSSSSPGIVVGTACTPHDELSEVPVEAAEVGDILAITGAGAYAIQLEGCLHLRPPARQVVLREDGSQEPVPWSLPPG